MVKYLFKKENGDFDLESSFNVERPNMSILNTITPKTEIYMVDIGSDNNIIFSKQILATRVLKEVLNLYPNNLFNLNEEFFVNDEYNTELYNTALHVIETRFKDDPTSQSPEEFTEKYNQHIALINEKEQQEILN